MTEPTTVAPPAADTAQDAETRGHGDTGTPPPVAAPAPPPAAHTVANATRTEREAELEGHLEREREARRRVETDAAYLRDENERLKAVGLAPPSAPKCKRVSFGWFEAED